MKQVEQNYRSGALRLVDVPAPGAGAGRLLVSSRVSLISSGTERQLVRLAKASLVGKAVARPDLVRRVIGNVRRDGLGPTARKVLARLDTPIPLGYSLVGEVLEIGPGVPGLAVRDRVACAGAGIANHAEFNAVPKHLAVPVPAGVDDDDASFVTLGAIALQGVRVAAPTLGERVVVMGLGLIGLLTVQVLRANGCRVLGFDPDPARVARALGLGADAAVAEGLVEAARGFSSGQGADAVIITASTPSSVPVNQAAEISRLKGRIVVVGLVGLQVDREPFYRRELDLRFSLSYGPGRHDPAYEAAGHDYPLPYVRWTEQRNMAAFLDLVADGRVTPKALVTHRFPIADAEEAYALMERGEPHLAILLTYPDAATRTPDRVIAAPRRPAQGEGTIGTAFIGLGTYAKGVLLPAVLARRDVRLTAVVTATGLSARHAAGKFGFALASTDPGAVLADPATRAVFIATRHETHARLAAQALDAGKHVFCEKPLALDDAGLDRVLDAARNAPGVLAVGFNRRFSPLLVATRTALEPRSGPLVMLYRINAGTLSPDHWTLGEEGGGRVLGEMCHFVDALTFLAGAPPVEVHAQAARGHADAVTALLRFADGSTGTIVYSALGDPGVPKEYLEVFADGRVVRLDDYRKLTVTRGGRSRVTRCAQDKGQAALVAAFLGAVAGRAGAPVPLDDLRAVTVATFAIADSLHQGATIALDPGP